MHIAAEDRDNLKMMQEVNSPGKNSDLKEISVFNTDSNFEDNM